MNSKIRVTLAKDWAPFNSKELFLKNKRREGYLNCIGMYYLERSYIVSLTKINNIYPIAYKTKGDQKHKEMQSLVGVHVKD